MTSNGNGTPKIGSKAWVPLGAAAAACVLVGTIIIGLFSDFRSIIDRIDDLGRNMSKEINNVNLSTAVNAEQIRGLREQIQGTVMRSLESMQKDISRLQVEVEGIKRDQKNNGK